MNIVRKYRSPSSVIARLPLPPPDVPFATPTKKATFIDPTVTIKDSTCVLPGMYVTTDTEVSDTELGGDLRE